MPILSTLGALTFTKILFDEQYFIWITDQDATFNDIRTINNPTGPSGWQYIVACGTKDSNQLVCGFQKTDDILSSLYPMYYAQSNTTGELYNVSFWNNGNYFYAGGTSSIGNGVNVTFPTGWTSFPTSFSTSAANTASIIYKGVNNNGPTGNNGYDFVTIGRNSNILRFQRFSVNATTPTTFVNSITVSANAIGRMTQNPAPFSAIYGKHYFTFDANGNVTFQAQTSDNSVLTDIGLGGGLNVNGVFVRTSNSTSYDNTTFGCFTDNAGDLYGTRNNNLVRLPSSGTANAKELSIDNGNIAIYPKSATTIGGETVLICGTLSNNKGFICSLPYDITTIPGTGTYAYQGGTFTYGNSNVTSSNSNVVLSNTALSVTKANVTNSYVSIGYDNGNLSFQTYTLGSGYEG